MFHEPARSISPQSCSVGILGSNNSDKLGLVPKQKQRDFNALYIVLF